MTSQQAHLEERFRDTCRGAHLSWEEVDGVASWDNICRIVQTSVADDGVMWALWKSQPRGI